MSDVRIKAPVVICEVINERLYRASLPNGKIILAFTRVLDRIPPLNVGDSIFVLLSLSDFNEGRLVPEDLSGLRVMHEVVDGQRSQIRHAAPHESPLPIGASSDSCVVASA